MGIALMFLLALYHMQSSIHSKTIDSADNLTPLDNNIDYSLVFEKNFSPEQTELQFRYPISAIGIDNAKNSVMVRFQKAPSNQLARFGTGWDAIRKDNFMHFGKRQVEQLPQTNNMDLDYYEEQPSTRVERSIVGGRDSRGDNFMRFGRVPKQDFMRFGRSPSVEFMRFGRNPHEDFMRFGRDPKEDFMRFGRSPHQDFMRFGRSPLQQFQADKNFMRFGRADNFMRFGRSQMSSSNFNNPEMRNDRAANFMRFGKRSSSEEAAAGTDSSQNQTKVQVQRNDIRAAVKLLQQKETGTDESNPVDKAINMLFNKQQSVEPQDREKQDIESRVKSTEQNDVDNGKNTDDSSFEQLYWLS